MQGQFHVSPKTGKAAACRSTGARGCPFGDSTPHFPTKEGAEKFIEKQEAAKNELISTLKKQPAQAPQGSDREAEKARKQEEWKARREEENRKQAEQAEAMKAEAVASSSFNAKQVALMYDEAYSDGHSSGFGEIQMYLDDRIEVMEDVKKLASNNNPVKAPTPPKEYQAPPFVEPPYPDGSTPGQRAQIFGNAARQYEKDTALGARRAEQDKRYYNEALARHATVQEAARTSSLNEAQSARLYDYAYAEHHSDGLDQVGYAFDDEVALAQRVMAAE